MEKITEEQYKEAKKLVLEYESQNSSTFVRGKFSKDDLNIFFENITVPRLTEKIFTEDDCAMLEYIIATKIMGIEWCNVEEVGYLSISFRSKITENHIKIVLESLNSLK